MLYPVSPNPYKTSYAPVSAWEIIAFANFPIFIDAIT